jgi:hypothetical protein
VNGWNVARSAAMLGVTAAVLSGCATKKVDIEATGAQVVPGTQSLYRFCAGDMLIFFTRHAGEADDEYEWFYPGGCLPTPPHLLPPSDSTDGDR